MLTLLLVLLHVILLNGDILYQEVSWIPSDCIIHFLTLFPPIGISQSSGFDCEHSLRNWYGQVKNESSCCWRWSILSFPRFYLTHRFSDATSSASAFDTVSPSFPYYLGYTANISTRYLRFTEYQLSADIQGISTFGAGDEAREAARLKITDQPNYLNFPAPSTNFSVKAAIKWNPSDFAIQEGETYRVEVLGQQDGYTSQMWYDGGIRVNSAGYSSYFDSISNCYVGMGRCRPHLRKRRRLPGANW